MRRPPTGRTSSTSRRPSPSPKLISEIQPSVANLRQTDKPLSQLNAKELEAMIAAAAQEELSVVSD